MAASEELEYPRHDWTAVITTCGRICYAPKTIDHIHDVLSAVLRTAVKWGHLQENPTRGVDLPALKTVRPKWVLTASQAASVLAELPPLARTMAGVAMLTGLRRGELFALRWKAVNLAGRHLTVQEAVYEGAFGTPKTEAGIRRVPLSESTLTLLTDWRGRVKSTEPDALVFSTWFGQTHFAEQRVTPMDLPGLRAARAASQPAIQQTSAERHWWDLVAEQSAAVLRAMSPDRTSVTTSGLYAVPAWPDASSLSGNWNFCVMSCPLRARSS